MLRLAYRKFAILALLAGLALRAITPLGYMPAAGADLLFELCPDQMPVTFSAAKAFPDHAHHHGSETESEGSADLCPVGHLLFSAVASDSDPFVEPIELQFTPPAPLQVDVEHIAAPTHFRSRAPPA
ncbi:MAG: hypothetical protein K0U72_15505 [Gammaproteobacteria bacterium]|nr:hypothetical protein [Gammaproteobacteria bacterium]